MKVVWELSDVAVAEVAARLRARRPLHHNTVMTVMQRLAKKGFLEEYARDGRTNGYRPRLLKDEVCRGYLALLKEQFFAGSAAKAAAALLASERYSRAKLATLRKLFAHLDDER